MTKATDKSFKDRLTVLLMKQFFLVTIAFTMLLIVLFLFAYYAGHRWITWYDSSSPFYFFFKFVDNYKFFTFMGFWGIGFVIITLFYWRRTIGYATQIIDSIERLYDSEMELVKLPADLKDVEDELNNIKYNSLKSGQLAKEAEQRKNDLVVYLAHDLKTPLTSVIGYLTLLRDEKNISDELKEKYLEVAVDKAERLETLINEFFEITRFNLNELVLEPSVVNLTRMLEQITDEFKPMMLSKNLTCTVDAEADITVRCDVEKMERVFDNLLRNSINYSYENSQIQVSAARSGQEVVLTFLNRGPTIPEHKLSHIFEQFYRLDTARTSQTGGAGLGLAIAKEIVELHGGTISASSENDTIRFIIRLPRSM